jgi:hypothetical protein
MRDLGDALLEALTPIAVAIGEFAQWYVSHVKPEPRTGIKGQIQDEYEDRLWWRVNLAKWRLKKKLGIRSPSLMFVARDPSTDERQPWEEPYTRRERLSITIALKKHDFYSWRTAKIWQSIARRLPQSLVYFATIHLWSKVTANTNEENPTAITFDEGLRRFGDPVSGFKDQRLSTCPHGEPWNDCPDCRH